jgi:hypothetical protein
VRRSKIILAYLWKVLVSAPVFLLGTIVGSMVAGFVGLQTPPLPEGTNAQTLLLLELLATPFLSLSLAFLSRGMQARFIARWLILSALAWVAYGVNTVLEAAIFTTYGAASPFTVVIVLFGSLANAAVVAALFAPDERARGFASDLKAFFSARSGAQWAWRLALAAVIFMPIYLFFGRLVVPLTYEYYQQQLAGLTAPGWGQILPVLFARSLLFLVVSLPVIATWGRSRRNLMLSLGFAMFVLVGGIGLLEGYWLPLSVRIIHGVEILADSLIYAWFLVILLARKPQQNIVSSPGLTEGG